MATVAALLVLGAAPAAVAEMRLTQAGAPQGGTGGVDPGMGETIDAPPGRPTADAGAGSGPASETGVSADGPRTSTPAGGRGGPPGVTDGAGADGQSSGESSGALQSPLMLLIGLGMVLGGCVYLFLQQRDRGRGSSADRSQTVASAGGVD